MFKDVRWCFRDEESVRQDHVCEAGHSGEGEKDLYQLASQRD